MYLTHWVAALNGITINAGSNSSIAPPPRHPREFFSWSVQLPEAGQEKCDNAQRNDDKYRSWAICKQGFYMNNDSAFIFITKYLLI